MSEESAPPEVPSPPPERPSGWFAFNEQQVFVQLKEPYIACTYGYQPDRTQDGGVKATPLLSGTLHVEPNGSGGIMLVLLVQLEGNDSLFVSMDPDMIQFCTHIHQSRIVTQ